MHWRRTMAMVSILIGMALVCEAHAQALNLPEIDFAVTVKTNTNKDHQMVYAYTLQRELGNCFGLLYIPPPKHITTLPKDGAANFRLYVEATVNASVGNNITSETSSAVAQNNKTDNYTQRAFYIQAGQTGNIQFRLCRWVDGKYQEVKKWTAPLPKSEEEEKLKGRLEIARVTSVQNQTCPVKLEDAQLQAMSKLVPGPMYDAVFSQWLQVTVTKATPAKGTTPPGPAAITNFEAELSIKNSSPWIIKRCRLAIPYQGQILLPGDFAIDGRWMTFKEPLASEMPQPLKITFNATLGPKDARPGLLGLDLAPAPVPAAVPPLAPNP